jgi:DNA-binding NarL/FixJ family response regulator
MTRRSARRPKPKLFLVDDHQLLLQGLRLALQRDYDIVGETLTGATVVEGCRALSPDVVLLDLSLPDRSGLEVITDLHAELPGIKILVVTMHADRIMADASLQSGAHGFVPKDAGIPELKVAIDAVLAGERFVSDLVPKKSRRFAPGDAALGLSRLTPRQREIVRLLGEGKSSADIAAAIHLKPETITFHRGRIRQILGIDSEWGLVRYALLVRMSEEEAKEPPT